MVVFTCNQCGDSLKKNKVDQHFRQCRTRSLTCVDCQRDFDIQSYDRHFECLTEDQKYGGLNYQQQEFKGKSKQNDWVQKIKSLISENQYPRDIQNVLRSLVHYDNIPRKKPKFANFVKNSFRIRDEQLIGKIWNIFETSIKTNNAQSNAAVAATDATVTNGSDKPTNGHENGLKRCSDTAEHGNGNASDNLNPEKNVKKAKLDLDEQAQCQEEVVKIKMKKVVKDILTDRSAISMSKLQKKVLKFYHKNGYTDDSEIERKFSNVINRQIAKSIFVINDDIITLAH